MRSAMLLISILLGLIPLAGIGWIIYTGTVTTVVVVGGTLVVVTVVVVVVVVVPPEPVLTLTPAPQCQPPLVLHTVTTTLVGVWFVRSARYVAPWMTWPKAT